MSYEFWIAAEKFLYDSFFINLLIIGILISFIINRLFYIGQKNSKTSNIIFSIVIILLIAFGINTTAKYNKYKVLYLYERHANYGIKNKKRTLFTYHYPTRGEDKAYGSSYLVDSFRKTTIYEEEIIIENVQYLGSEGDKYYFQDKDQIIYRNLGNHLEIVDNISAPIREGVKFFLKDSRFKEIGFKEKSSHPYLLNYKIPKSESSKKFENLSNMKISPERDFRLGWINPTDSNQLPSFE